MVVVRPVEMADIPALEALVAVAARGVHTLPRSRAKIAAAVERSLASFAAEVDIQGEESYVFVLEAGSGAAREVIGTASIFATAGTNGTYFAFRNDVVQHVSRDLNISHSVHALTLCSELTAYSQLASFFVRDASGIEQAAALLSRSRLMFAAMAPHRFNDRFFVPLAGMNDAAGESPFWDALGRKFFQMDFIDAERVIEGARNRTLIVELMPPYPVYVPLLPGAAQAAMGQVHPDGALPFKLLTEEGFEADEYVDIFDGGPILLAHKNSLRTMQRGMLRQVELADSASAASALATAPSFMLANRQEQQFRAVIGQGLIQSGSKLLIGADTGVALGVVAGDTVFCVES